MRRPRIHLAWCDHCGRKIAWSRKRRQWLALAPFTNLREGPLARRMHCTGNTDAHLHDPRSNPATGGRLARLIGGVR